MRCFRTKVNALNVNFYFNKSMQSSKPERIANHSIIYFSSNCNTYKNEGHEEKYSDPIINKYKSMLKNMSYSKIKSELKDINYKTNFGSVRFDSDNNINSQIKTNLRNEENENEESPTNLNYIDELYFRNELHNISNTEQAFELHNKNFEKSDIDDVSIIEQQYLKIHSFNDADGPGDKYNSSVDTSELNYIDKQIFNIIEDENKVNKQIDDSNGSSTIDKPLNSVESNLSLYNFEDALSEGIESDSLNSEIYHSVDLITQDDKRREILEKELLQLSEEASNIVKYNPKLKQRPDNTEKEINNAPLKDNKLEVKHPKEKMLNQDQGSIRSNTKDSGQAIETNFQSNTKDALAYDFVKKLRKDEGTKDKSEILSTERFRKILLLIPSYSKLFIRDMANLIKKSIIYNDNGVVAIYKPYGIPIHGGGNNAEHNRLNIVNVLPELADIMKEDVLIPVHRLDMNTTGVLLFGKNQETADKLKEMFKNQTIHKKYLAIVKGQPKVNNGLIDIPIGEGKVDRYDRMVLRPHIPDLQFHSKNSKKALTRYKVLSKSNGCSLLELNPITGIKHQIRVHLGFGLNCPILGDHKYSFLNKIAPQKLPGDALEKLGMKQTWVRRLPLYLHAFSVSIPCLDDSGRDIFVRVGPPKFFRTTLQILKLSSRKNRLSDDFSELIYGYE